MVVKSNEVRGQLRGTNNISQSHGIKGSWRRARVRPSVRVYATDDHGVSPLSSQDKLTVLGHHIRLTQSPLQPASPQHTSHNLQTIRKIQQRFQQYLVSAWVCPDTGHSGLTDHKSGVGLLSGGRDGEEGLGYRERPQRATLQSPQSSRSHTSTLTPVRSPSPKGNTPSLPPQQCCDMTLPLNT